VFAGMRRVSCDQLKSLLSGTTMKLVSIKGQKIGLLVQLRTGPHVVDIMKSLGVFTAHDPVSGALINGVLKERCAWVALVNNWDYLRMPFKLLARTALTNADDSRLAIYPFAYARQTSNRPRGIVAIDITDAADLEIHDPTGRLVMAGQFNESVDDQVLQDASPMGENVQVVDFSRHSEPRTPR
jgi:hypothetical protein